MTTVVVEDARSVAEAERMHSLGCRAMRRAAAETTAEMLRIAKANGRVCYRNRRYCTKTREEKHTQQTINIVAGFVSNPGCMHAFECTY